MHYRLGHTLVLCEHGFDLAQFDAKTAQLDLVIDPADHLHRAVRAPERQVAGAVEARVVAFRERIGDEFLGGEIGATAVPRGQAFAADQQFARHADRKRLHVPVDDVDLRIVDRTADDDRTAAGLDLAQRRIDGGFGRAVKIPQLAAHGQQAVGQLARQRFAGGDDAHAGLARPTHVQQHPPRRRRGLHDRQRFGIDQLAQAQPVAHGVAIDQQDARADRQRNHQLGERDVERQRADRADGVVGADARFAGDRTDQVDGGFLADFHAFRLAGRARSEDHVGRIVRADAAVGARLRRRRQRCVGINHDHRRHGHRQRIAQRRLGDQYGRTRGFHHVRQTVHRIAGIQRHVGTAGLEDRHQADQHFQRALDVEPDQHAGLHAQRAQFDGDRIGAEIELAVTHGPGAELHRGRIGGTHHLFREQCGDRGIARKLAERVVPARLLLALRCGEQRQFGHRRPRRIGRRFQQGEQMPAHAPDRRIVVQLGAVLEHQFAFVMLVHEQAQIALRGRRADIAQRDILHANPGHHRVIHRIALEEIHDLRERRVADRTRQAHVLENAVQRRVRILHRMQQGRMRAREDFDEIGVSGQVGAQRQRVDEEADHRLQFVPAATGDAHGGHHLFLARIARQQDLERRQHHGRQRGLPFARKRLQARVQRRRNIGRTNRAAEGLRRRARPVGRKIEHRGCAVEMLFPEIELRTQTLAAPGLVLPQRDIGDLQFGRRRVDRFARAQAVVGLEHFAEQAGDRPAVDGDVMERDHQQVQIGSDGDQRSPDRRTGLQREGFRGFLARDPEGIFTPRVQVVAFGGAFAPRQGLRRENFLVRLAGIRRIDRPQHFVTIDPRLDRATQIGGIEFAVQPLRGRRIVGHHAGRKPVEQPQPALAERQRDVLWARPRADAGSGHALA